MDSTPLQPLGRPSRRNASQPPALHLAVMSLVGEGSRTASERVLAAELENRASGCDALSMMVSSIARMVQAGRSSDNRWKST
ncbi:MAG: hypothetical protein NT158_02805 [Cyanobacteria bacterium]|nr:hypothetical protein [Cyanobacteriota bacterium]